MLKSMKAIVKDGKIWKRGRFDEEGTFTTEGEFEKLSDAKDGSKVKMLKTVIGEDKVEETLKELGFASIYIIEEEKPKKETKKKEKKSEPLEETVEQFDERWWKEQNNKCLECTKKCKQSGKADVIFCSDFETKS